MFYLEVLFMKRKYTRLAIVFVVLFQMFVLSISEVYAQTNNTKKQPAVCGWPSETMQQYFLFQKEARAALYASDVNVKKLSAYDTDWWLFTKKDLSLPSSALDYVVTSLWWRASSIISSASTSVVLLLLASASVIQSDVEWLAIFVKDRPIVRDYKEMLDIETEIFDTAYSFSKKIDLRRAPEWNAVENFKAVVKKYQDSWLLRKWAEINWNVSMADILLDLTSMNAAMKFFIAKWGEMWASELRSYAWCLWQWVNWKCDSSNPALWFDYSAVAQLKEDYKGIWVYWACNESASHFQNTTYKMANNNADSVKVAMNDVKIAWDNLVNALIWKWTWSKVLTDPCKMSDYERAQLDAYRWWNRECWEWISLSTVLWNKKNSKKNGGNKSENKGSASASSPWELVQKSKEYQIARKTLAEQSESFDSLTKRAWSSTPPSVLNVIWGLNEEEFTEGKELLWHNIYDGESRYNPEFSYGMNYEFYRIYSEITEQFENSQRAAMASDISYELFKFKWLVEQVNKAMKSASQLRKDLQDIVDYQCSM